MKHSVTNMDVESAATRVTSQFAAPALVRLKSIIAPGGPIPVSKSTWWSKVRTGEYPRPMKLGPRTTVWRSQDIADLIRRIEAEAGYGS